MESSYEYCCVIAMKGVGNHLLKASSKRRRTRAEVLESKKTMEVREVEISQKLQQLADLERQLHTAQ